MTERRQYAEGDIDPECLRDNPGLDDYSPNCCRFPKSCSPTMNAARAAALNAEAETADA